MKSVFVVECGERYEGSTVIGVYFSEEKAVKVALNQDTCFDGGWKLQDENYWTNGCDFVRVKEYEVRE